MLDPTLIEQLKTVFTKLVHPVELVYLNSDHADQAQLLELLQAVAIASPLLSVRPDLTEATQSQVPSFYITASGRKTGVSFRGIPNGHEFSSLIIAILNADHQGKMPDAAVTARIQRLKASATGPIKIETYISLTCENCPDVVQALNQMAIVHPNFEHTMIDGAYFQDDIARLGIQGVPSVMIDSKLVYSGKLNFLELMTKLESVIGVESAPDGQASVATDLGCFDVVVIGGGPAGSSAAIYSARKGRSVAVIAEKAGGQVSETKGIENLISVKYTEGPQLVAQLNQHMAEYPIQIFEHQRVLAVSEPSDKTLIQTITLESGATVQARAIIVSTGAKWRELNVPGEKEYLGRGVAFCPHCDGPFYKNKPIAVVGGGNSGVEAAIDLAGIVSQVTLLEFGPQLKADAVLVKKLLSLPNTRVITQAQTTEVMGDGKKVIALEYLDRESQQKHQLKLDGIFVQIGLLPNSQFIKDRVETTPFGEIKIDTKCRTSAKGIYAAGDVTTIPYKQIVIAMGEGAKAALSAFEDQLLGA